MDKLKDVLELLLAQETEILRTQYCDHQLKGQWKGYRELHIEKD